MRFEYGESDGLSIFKNARLRSTVRKNWEETIKHFLRPSFQKILQMCLVEQLLKCGMKLMMR